MAVTSPLRTIPPVVIPSEVEGSLKQPKALLSRTALLHAFATAAISAAFTCSVIFAPAALAAEPNTAAASPSMPNGLHWKQLAPIPDPEGFASTFAGVSGGALIVAGGANIPENKWAATFTKKWYDTVWILPQPTGQWRTSAELRLPSLRAYGVSATWQDAVLCAGGSNESGHTREVFALRWNGATLTRTPLPPLPRDCANACGALLDGTWYIAGGIETPAATTALHTFWALDLKTPGATWRELEPCPGPPRMLAVVGTCAGRFFLFSGASLHADTDGKPARTFLRDAWSWTPGQGWQQLADLPRAAVAAPSPAPAIDDKTLLVLTGDDGLNVDFQPITQHPGFPRDALAYDVKANAWSTLPGAVPCSRATVPVTEWSGAFIIPNGEARPRERSPEVWSLSR